MHRGYIFASASNATRTTRCRSEELKSVLYTAPGLQAAKAKPLRWCLSSVGRRPKLALVAIKSAIAYSTSPLHLIILADKQNEAQLKKQVESWPTSIKKRVHAQLKPVPPPTDPDRALEECAAQQLYLP
ncbi:hypothetical protein MTO96_038258, partial [Rhipicephalus appendiculatus]